MDVKKYLTSCEYEANKMEAALKRMRRKYESRVTFAREKGVTESEANKIKEAGEDLNTLIEALNAFRDLKTFANEIYLQALAIATQAENNRPTEPNNPEIFTEREIRRVRHTDPEKARRLSEIRARELYNY